MRDRSFKIGVVAEITGYSKRHIYRLVHSGIIPHFWTGAGGLRFYESKIDEWMTAGGTSKARFSDRVLKKLLKKHPEKRKIKLGGAKMAKFQASPCFGSVYQRKAGGNFTIDYRKRDGQRVQRVIKNAKNQQEAEEALKSAVIKEFSIEDGRKQNIAFTEFAGFYLRDYAMNEKKSWKTDEYRLNVLKEYFKDTDLRYINARMIRQFKAERLRKGNTEASCNRYLALLKRMFTLAIDDNYCSENPVKKVKFFSEANREKYRVLTQKEEAKLLESCPMMSLKPIVVIALHTGMRRGEILALKWKNVDMLKRVITVENTKSGKMRLIPINDVSLAVLTRLRKEATNKFVFPFHFRKVRIMFENARRQAKLKVRFHDLRHTFATRLIERGADIITVQQLLGHHSVTVTMKYAHSNEDRKRQAVELLKVHAGDKRVTNSESDYSEKLLTHSFPGS